MENGKKSLHLSYTIDGRIMGKLMNGVYYESGFILARGKSFNIEEYSDAKDITVVNEGVVYAKGLYSPLKNVK